MALDSIIDFVQSKFELPYKDVRIAVSSQLWFEMFEDLGLPRSFANSCCSTTIGVDGFSVDVICDTQLPAIKSL